MRRRAVATLRRQAPKLFGSPQIFIRKQRQAPVRRRPRRGKSTGASFNLGLLVAPLWSLAKLLSPVLLLVLLGSALSRLGPFSWPFGGKPEAVSPHFISGLVEPMLSPQALEERAEVAHKVGSGETLSSIAGTYGFSGSDADRIYSGLDELKKSKGLDTRIKAGQVLTFSLGEDGEILSLSFPISATDEILVARKADGSFKAQALEVPKNLVDRVFMGEIESSFASAVQSARVPYALADDLVDLFSHKVKFHRDFRRGDRFAIIFRERKAEDGTVIESGPILAAGIEAGGKRLIAIRYVGIDGKARYFDEQGHLLGSYFLRYPLKFSRISSVFSHSRMHPILKRRRPHHGVDFAAPIGTPVRAVADGRVISAGYQGQAGKMIKVEHSKRYSTAYLHLSRFAPGIRRGSLVTRGQVIGAVGSTGSSTGPHLDFRFYDSGRAVNPLTVSLPSVEVLDRGSAIKKPYLERVLFTLEHYLGFSSEGPVAG